MTGDMEMPAADRLVALFDHLGIERAHIASQVPADIAGLASGHADRLCGIVLCVPTRLDPSPFVAVGDLVLMISGASGPTVGTTARAAERLPGAVRAVLDGYDAPGWADVAADRTDQLAGLMIGFLD